MGCFEPVSAGIWQIQNNKIPYYNLVGLHKTKQPNKNMYIFRA